MRLRVTPAALRWARLALETAALLGGLLIVDAAFFDGDRFAHHVAHPFAIVVLLMASQYGLSGGAFAAGAASLALYLGASFQPLPGDDFYDFAARLAGPPTLFLVCAIVFGGLRSLHLAREADLARRAAEAEAIAAEIAEGLASALSEIERLERRIASETATLDASLGGVAALDRSSAAAFARSAERLVCDVGGAAAFAIYAFTPQGFEALVAFDEDGPAKPRPPWASRAALEARLASAPLVAGQPNADLVVPAGAAMAAPIGAQAFVVIERLRPGAAAKPERLRLVAAALSSLWPEARHAQGDSAVIAA